MLMNFTFRCKLGLKLESFSLRTEFASTEVGFLKENLFTQ